MVELWKPIIKQYSGRAKSSRKGWKVVMWTPTGRKERSLGKKFTTPEAAANDIIAKERQKPLRTYHAEIEKIKSKRKKKKLPRHTAQKTVEMNKIKGFKQQNQLLEKLLPKGIKYSDIKGRPVQKHMHYTVTMLDKNGVPLATIESHKRYTLSQLQRITEPLIKKGLTIDEEDAYLLQTRWKQQAEKLGIHKQTGFYPTTLAGGRVARATIKVQFKSA